MRVLVISERKGRKSKRKTRKKRERKKVNTVLLHMCVCEKKKVIVKPNMTNQGNVCVS